jgi:Rieske Fe-S protein
MSFNDGYSFIENFIIYKSDNSINIYSDKCTHLGCRINKVANNNLICSCHGSKFSSDGRVLNSPAIRNLKKLKYKIDYQNNRVIIENEV